MATGVLALKNAVQLAATAVAAEELPADEPEAALDEAAGADDAAAELGDVLAAELPLLLPPQAARVTPSAAHARTIRGDLLGLIADTFLLSPLLSPAPWPPAYPQLPVRPGLVIRTARITLPS